MVKGNYILHDKEEIVVLEFTDKDWMMYKKQDLECIHKGE